MRKVWLTVSTIVRQCALSHTAPIISRFPKGNYRWSNPRYYLAKTKFVIVVHRTWWSPESCTTKSQRHLPRTRTNILLHWNGEGCQQHPLSFTPSTAPNNQRRTLLWIYYLLVGSIFDWLEVWCDLLAWAFLLVTSLVTVPYPNLPTYRAIYPSLSAHVDIATTIYCTYSPQQ